MVDELLSVPHKSCRLLLIEQTQSLDTLQSEVFLKAYADVVDCKCSIFISAKVLKDSQVISLFGTSMASRDLTLLFRTSLGILTCSSVLCATLMHHK